MIPVKKITAPKTRNALTSIIILIAEKPPYATGLNKEPINEVKYAPCSCLYASCVNLAAETMRFKNPWISTPDPAYQ